MDKFLDGCDAGGGFREVSIVHGKGTGVLRSEHLSSICKPPSRTLQEFRLGRYGEGEDGVTIVTHEGLSLPFDGLCSRAVHSFHGMITTECEVSERMEKTRRF